MKAKLLAGLAAPESRVGLILALLSVAGWSYGAGLEGFLALLSTSALFLLFAYLLGAATALRTRTMRGAFALGGGILLLVLFVLPWLTRAFAPGGGAGLLEGVGQSLHPGTFLEGLDRDEPAVPARAPFLMVYLLAYGLACTALYGGLVRAVDRMGSRAS